jgi:hypothetical protein
MKTIDKIFCGLLMIALMLCIFGLCMATAKEPTKNPYEQPDTIIYIFDVQEQMDMEKYFTAYCREIDSLVYSYGMEIDADAVDIEDEIQMEQAAYELLGDKFYTWRQRESKYAWIRDVYIARYAY